MLKEAGRRDLHISPLSSKQQKEKDSTLREFKASYRKTLYWEKSQDHQAKIHKTIHLKVHRLKANAPIICLLTLAADMGTGLHALVGRLENIL